MMYMIHRSLNMLLIRDKAANENVCQIEKYPIQICVNDYIKYKFER